MNERRMIVVLLTVIAVVLTLNLMTGPRTAVAQYESGPGEPTVVAGAMTDTSHTKRFRFARFWSDGRVDTTFVEFVSSAPPRGCEIDSACTGEILPGSCSSDTDRNGNVEFPDLLNVLSDWGPCE